MYNLTDEQIESVETFIGKIPESMIRAKVEKWLEEIKPTKRITSEQMLQFTDFSTHLPTDVQNFPQSFLHTVRNEPKTLATEDSHKIKHRANLTSNLDESIAHVEDKESHTDSEQTEHTLGRTKQAVNKKSKK